MTKLLSQLGYVGFEVSSLAKWESFATGVLGLGASSDPKTGSLFLRMDLADRRFILVEGPSDDVAFVGWQTADLAALDAFAAHLDACGVSYEWGGPEELALRGARKMLHFKDPVGIRHEAFCDALMARERFVSPSVAGSFVTGDAGAGHVVFGASDYQAALDFAQKVLGASMTDVIRQPVGPNIEMEVSFLHINERHHSIAYASMGGKKKMHHFMIEVDRVDEVGRARDRALKAGCAVEQDIGQHPNDRMISIYVATPSGFLVEFGWGGIKVHDDDWRVVTYPAFSEWGHRPAVAS